MMGACIFGARQTVLLAIGAIAVLAAAPFFHARHATAEGGKGAAKDAERGQMIDPASVNATCYVCHMMFVREPISRDHFKKKVTCIDCHGVSAGHANDEDIGATPPDVVYGRNQVDAMCGKCHEHHNVAAVKIVARHLERKIVASPVVCTDCHGNHRIAPPEDKEAAGQ